MIYLINTAVLTAVFILSYFLVKEIRKNHFFTVWKDSMQEKSQNRRKEEELKVLEDGAGQETGYFYKLDLTLYQSGIQKKIPFITAEVFLVVMIFFMITSFIVFLTVLKSAVFSIIAVITVGFLFYMLLELLMIYHTEKIEEDIMKFVNLLENYSKTSDDIISIMNHVWPYLNEPLKSAVHTCCNEGLTSGNIPAAFKRLELSVRHRQFSELIRNIEICSRYNADYSAVIRKNKKVLESYLAEKKVRKQMANNSRLQILVLYGGAALVLKMMEEICENSIWNMLSVSLPGMIILIFSCFVILYSIRQLLVLGRK